MARKSRRLTASVVALAAALLVFGSAAGSPSGLVRSPARAAPRRDDAREEFMRRVYEAQRSLSRSRPPFKDLPEDELEAVEGRHKMRKAPARQLKLLLKQAKNDLRREKEGGGRDALKVSDLGVHSAYRSVAYDRAAWHNAFNKHFNLTRRERAELRGGEYGDEALALMVARMRKYKAFPGRSKHTGGLAVDFKTIDDGVLLASNSNQNGRWKRSWFHKWLVRNARKFKFKPLASEAWHWEYSK